MISWTGVPDSTAQIVLAQLARYLGPSTAKTALKTFCDRAVKKPPEQISKEDAIPLITALQPMLRTLLGTNQCDELVKRMKQELGV